MNYQANDEVMVYTWIGTGHVIKVPFGKAWISGRVKYLDNSVYFEVEFRDELGIEWINEDNLIPFSEYTKHEIEDWDLIDAEMGWE